MGKGRVAKTKEQFVAGAMEVHEDKYSYEDSVYVSSQKNIVVWCKKCEEFFTIIAGEHLRGQGCQVCGGKRRTAKSFIRVAVKTHGDKYSYDRVKYISDKKKVEIYCKACRSYFFQTPHSHLSGLGCAKCGSNKKNLEMFVADAIKTHDDKYDYSKVVYIDSKHKVTICCKTCGYVFDQTPNDHLRGYGCVECAGTRRKTQEEFVSLSKSIHGENKFDYSRVNYRSMHKKVELGCKLCGEWFSVKPLNHIHCKNGCPGCAYSKGETQVSEILDSIGIVYSKQHVFPGCKHKKSLRFDFWLPENFACIEFQGAQHYKPVGVWGGEEGFAELQKRDAKKRLYCEQNNINLIEVKFDCSDVASVVLEGLQIQLPRQWVQMRLL